MDQILQGIPGAFSYLDDIIVIGSTLKEHLERLATVLKRLEEYDLKANWEKSKFLRSSVEYLGHVILGEGLHQSPKKVKAITEMPKPQEVTQLRALLVWSSTTPSSYLIWLLTCLLCIGCYRRR